MCSILEPNRIPEQDSGGVTSREGPSVDSSSAVGPPALIITEATYQEKTANCTFTVTDHFSPRRYYSSAVVGNNMYVIATFHLKPMSISDEGPRGSGTAQSEMAAIYLVLIHES